MFVAITQTRALLLRGAVVFALAALAYGVMAGDWLTKQSVAPHFVYLAQAWLHGRSALIEPLPSYYDLIFYRDQWYVAQQPLPALLLLPIVWLRGAAGTPDVLFTALLGAMSVALCDVTLRVFVPDLTPARRSWLVLFFALGTVHGYLSALGTVWFTGQVAAALFLWLLLLGLVGRQPLLAGAALGAVSLARPSVLPGGLALAAAWWMTRPDSNHVNSGQGTALLLRIKNGLLFSLPLIGCLAFLGWYNHARFGSLTDFGYDYIQEAPDLLARRLEHGNFSPAFLPENVYTAAIRPPRFADGKIEPDPWGMGLLLTSPLLVYGGAAVWRRFSQAGVLALSAGIMLLPALLYHNTGSVQFGYRFVLDALPLLMVLVGCGARRGSIWLLGGLTLYSVAVHLWGYAWLYEVITGQAWHW